MLIHLRDLRRPARIRVDRWGIPHIEAKNDSDLFLAQGFNAARDRLWQISSKLLGSEPSRWRWGEIHQAFFEHPLSNLQDVTSGLDIGPFPVGGDSSTPMHAAPRLLDRRVTHCASVRLIMDVGDWDRSLCINTPGQSGFPDSKFYGNLAPQWARGFYVPLLFSKSAVEAATETVIDLVPSIRPS